MFIKRIETQNFKSFRHIVVDLQDLNVLVGPNAAGKSNFVGMLKFLKDIARDGLGNAVARAGGFKYVKNTNADAKDEVSFSITYDLNTSERMKHGNLYIDIKELVYEFSIQHDNKTPGFSVTHDKVTLFFTEFIRQDELTKAIELLGKGQIAFFVSDAKIQVEADLPHPLSTEEVFPFVSSFPETELTPGTLLLQSTFLFVLHFTLGFKQAPFSEMGIYDFDPKFKQHAVPSARAGELEEDGSNLPLKLMELLSFADDRRKFLNLVRAILPFVEDIEIQKQMGEFVFFSLKEKHTPSLYVPSFLLSDGTVNIVSLVYALYFDGKSPIVLEEPDRHIHPHIVHRLVALLNEVAEETQLFITTHSPEVVKHVNLEDLLLISRDRNGYSTVSRPIERENVKIFLENEIGAEELFVDNLLGV